MNNGLNSAMIALTSVVGIAAVALGIALTTFGDGEQAQGGLIVVAGFVILGGLVAMSRGVRGARGIVAVGTIVPAALTIWSIVTPLIAIAICAWLLVSARAGAPRPVPGH